MPMPVETGLAGVHATWATEVDVPFWSGNTVTSSPGGDAILTYPPQPNVKYRVGGILFSCDSSALPGSNPLIDIRLSTGQLVFRQNVSIFPLGQIIFKPPSSTPPGVGLTISMSSAGIGKTVYLNANVWAYTAQGTQ